MTTIITRGVFALLCFAGFAQPAIAQIETAILMKIVRAEDERRWDSDFEILLKNSNEKIRVRAALAAGRIGDDRAISSLANLLETDSDSVRAMAAFAIGEIESAKGADPIFKSLLRNEIRLAVRARLVEAAGKISAANPRDALSRLLGETMLETLEQESTKLQPDRLTILLGLTAILRARPEKGEILAAKFLSSKDARIRADAANTLARMRAKGFNEKLRAMLLTDTDPNARANAARALGSAEDSAGAQILAAAATDDADSRVRVSATRALASLKDRKSAAQLLPYAGKLLVAFKKSKAKSPSQKNELLDLAATIGRILQNTNDSQAVNWLKVFRFLDGFRSPETEIAFARIAPERYLEEFNKNKVAFKSWRTTASFANALSEFAQSSNTANKSRAENLLRVFLAKSTSSSKIAQKAQLMKSAPEVLRALGAFKSADLSEILRKQLDSPDVFVRAAAAGLLSDLPKTKENFDALKRAFTTALLTDRVYNDAQLAVLDALFKLDAKESAATLMVALEAPDYLVRKKAFDLLRTSDPEGSSQTFASILNAFIKNKQNTVLPFSPLSSSRLGQVLNNESDYARAISRRNGETRAIVATTKGKFVIELLPEDAPLTVDNFIKLARGHYFDRVFVHRVVPNFVIQDGDQRGDGNGGPGWQIRCEINMVPYERGAVGMALSGKDTGGSQWFITHSPQPHLDGGYTLFGRVNETDMQIVDAISRGDKILEITIIEAGQQPEPNRARRRR